MCVSAFRHQAHLDAPLEDVWGLVATPSRYPEWWPRVIEVRGERFEEGDEWAQVTQEGKNAGSNRTSCSSAATTCARFG